MILLWYVCFGACSCTVNYVNTNKECSLYNVHLLAQLQTSACWNTDCFLKWELPTILVLCCFRWCHVIDRQGLARCRRLEAQSVEATTRETRDKSNFVSTFLSIFLFTLLSILTPRIILSFRFQKDFAHSVGTQPGVISKITFTLAKFVDPKV